MSFQTPITIAKVLDRVQGQEYMLPAIQREFVWGPDQIARLFDSLLRDYPIGSFLFWQVDGQHSSEFKFYGFMKDYHQLKNPHCPVLDIPHGKSVVAILDGQQRITALNIGLRGSHASRLPGKWWRNASSYPEKRLYLNLCGEAPENELGMRFDLRFFEIPPSQGQLEGEHWFPVHKIMDPDLSPGPGIFKYVQAHGLQNYELPFELLSRLHRVVHEVPVINFYEESDQDLDKVLDIFIRVNSGGTVLSYSDLLLSIATAQWTARDAREEIQELVDELNKVGQGFSFTKDVVLKAGLVLTEVSDVGFKVTNFNRTNMVKLEQQWDGVAQALRLASGLLADFGFSATTLTANSILIPIAHYVHRRGVGESYRTAGSHAEDRRLLRTWVVRSLIKPGIWGSGLDTLLRDLRRVIDMEGSTGFPLSSIESAMASRGKSLDFSAAEIDDLLETSYGNRRTFPLLVLLFPHIDTRNLFHVDHVFPRALFRRTTIQQAGLDPSRLDELLAMANTLPNLQLLEGAINVEKQAELPLTWATRLYHEPGALDNYLARNDLVGLPENLADFPKFHALRRQRMAVRLAHLLGAEWDASKPPTELRPMGLPSSVTNLRGFIRLVLTRRPVPNAQRALFRALYDVGEVGLSYSQLTAAIGTTPKEFRGVLGALGNRINRTPRENADDVQYINAILDFWKQDGEWHCRLRPDLRAELEDLHLV